MTSAVLGAGLMGSILGGCGDQDTVTIVAAASLSVVMPQLITLAEENAGADTAYEVSYAGSAQLVQQVNSGAQPDVMVLAGEGPLAALTPELGFSEPSIVATNSLAVVTAPDNPARIEELEDIAAADVTLVTCAPAAPCGSAAAQMFAEADLKPVIASLEPDVRATLAKVSAGEADAGVVYVTDAAKAGLPTIEIPPRVDVVNPYPLLYDEQSEAGRQFLDLVQSSAGQRVLTGAGFGIP